jgi:hypothetical protein
MRNLRLGMAIATLLLPGTLAAQQNGDQSKATTATPPIAGANSFTEGQARDRIAKAGFQNVKDLKQDREGVWRGKAQKGGREVAVSLDYRGNVVQQ